MKRALIFIVFAALSVLPILADEYRLDSLIHSSWSQVYWKEVYEYDAQQRLSTITEFKALYFNHIEWDPQLRYEYTYDENDRLIDLLFSCYERDDSGMYDWYPFEETVYTYNAEGLKTNEQSCRWVDSVKGPDDCYYYTYNEEGRLSSSLHYTYGDEIEYRERDDYEYYSDGNLWYQIGYYFNNGEWKKDQKDIYYYYDSGQVKRHIKYKYHYLWGPEGWVPSNDYRWEYFYDTNGRVEYYVSYKADYGYTEETNEYYVSAWNLEGRYDYLYDDSGHTIATIFRIWRNDQWESSHKYEYTFDSEGNCTAQIEYRSDGTSFGWNLDKRIDYYYSPWQGSEGIEEVRIRPHYTQSRKVIDGNKILIISNDNAYNLSGKPAANLR